MVGVIRVCCFCHHSIVPPSCCSFLCGLTPPTCPTLSDRSQNEFTVQHFLKRKNTAPHSKTAEKKGTKLTLENLKSRWRSLTLSETYRHAQVWLDILIDVPLLLGGVCFFFKVICAHNKNAASQHPPLLLIISRKCVLYMESHTTAELFKEGVEHCSKQTNRKNTQMQNSSS